MDVRKELGQLLMIGLKGPTVTAAERKFIRSVRPAGVIYFRRNVESPRQLAALSAELWKMAGGGPPPLIAVDQEGGRVFRLGPPFTGFPSAGCLGNYFRRTGKLDLLRAQVKAQAAELRAVGVTWNLVPVADVQSNPRNPIVGDRAFGAQPGLAARLVAETVRAYRREKIASCAKHFPGHGDTRLDSHLALPAVRAPRATLLRREIPPFLAAVRAGVPCVMTAHVIYRALDPKRPATLSPGILTGLLRGKLGFGGVCVSDDLEMAAVAAHHRLAEAAVEAVAAGVDLLLVCKSLSEAEAIYEGLGKNLRRRKLPASRIEEALGRIRRFKREYLPARGFRPPSRLPVRGWAEHRKVAARLAAFGG